jgi:hypothetical protein
LLLENAEVWAKMKSMDSERKSLLNEAVRFVASLDDVTSFSLPLFADHLQMKEETLRTYFSSEEKLISAASLLVFNSEMSFLDDLNSRGNTFPVWTNRVLDYFLFHKEETLFLLSYGRGIARASLSPKEVKEYHDDMAYWGRRILAYFVLKDDDEYSFVFSSLYRSFIYAAANILRGECEDTPAMRDILIGLMAHGMNSFAKGGAL